MSEIKTFTVGGILEVDGEITLGTLILNVDYNGIRPSHNPVSVVHYPLGASYSKRQNMGKNSTTYELKGIFEGTNKDTDMATLKGYLLNHTEVLFQGYTGLDSAVFVEVIELAETEYPSFWEWTITIEETGSS